MSLQAYKLSGLLSIVIIWMAIGTLLLKWRGDKSMSISKHAAAHKRAALFFGGVLIVAAIMFVEFMVGWFIPVLALPTLSYWLIYFVGFLYIIGAIVPDTDGLSHFVHYWAAVVAAWLLMPLLVISMLSSKVSGMAKIVTLICVAYSFCVWVYVKLLRRGKSHFLLYQISYFAAFHVSILFLMLTVHSS